MVTFMNFDGPNFTLQVPTNWYITSSPHFQAIFLAPYPPGQDEPKGIRPNLAISLRPVQEDVTVEAVAAEAQKVQQEKYSQYEVLDEMDYTQDGGIAFYRKYRWVNEEGQAVIQIQVYIILARVLFSLTATRGEGNDAYDAELDEIFEHMISSFKLRPQIVARADS